MLERYGVALGQFKPVWMNPEKNLDRMASMVAEAITQEPRVKLVVFPERATTGSVGKRPRLQDLEGLKTAFQHAETVPGRMTEVLGAAAKRHSVWIATGFIERDERLDGVLYNSAALIGPDGRVIGVQRKCHISPTETDYFRPGQAIHTYPTDLGVIGLSICYDFWFPEYVRKQVLAGCQLHVCCTNNQPAFILGNVEMAVVRAVENQIFVAACNRVGRDEETGYGYLGRSRIVAPDGTVLAEGGDTEEVILTGIVDYSELLRWRAFIGIHKDRRADLFDR